MSYVEWAEEVAKKANKESCTVTTVIMELSKEMAKGKDEEKAKVDAMGIKVSKDGGYLTIKNRRRK